MRVRAPQHPRRAGPPPLSARGCAHSARGVHRPVIGGARDLDADDAQLAGLSSWLSSLGLEPRACDLVADAGGLLCAWCDGLPLVRLVETLEGRQIASIERAPRSSAQGLRNIEKALEVLRVRKGLPLTHLYHSHRLSKGEAATIVPLVADLRASWRRVGGGARNRPPVAAPMRAAPGATGKPSASRVGCCTLR